MNACVLSHFSCVQLYVTPWTVAHQASLSMWFSRQDYWSGLPCPPPGYFPNWGINLTSWSKWGLVVLGHFSRIQLFETLWTIAQQAPLSMDSPGKTIGVGCHFFFQGIFLSQESNPCLLCLLTCQAVYHCISWKPLFCKSVIFLIRKIKFTEL